MKYSNHSHISLSKPNPEWSMHLFVVRCSLLAIMTIFGFSPLFGQNVDPVKGNRISFEKQVLTTEFLAEGVGVGDVNHVGLVDVMAGAYWFVAPKWNKHALSQAQKV